MSRKPPRHITQKSASADAPAQPDRPDPVEKPQGAVPDASHFDGADQASSDRSYAVGYGRPPLHSRFKPGQSGNPKGRPRTSRNLRTIVKKVCEQDMEIREGGRLRRMPTMEVLVRTLLSRGLKGDPKAVASLMVLFRQSGYAAEQDETAADPLATQQYEEIVADYLADLKPDTSGNADELKAVPPAAAPQQKQKE